MRQCHTYKRLLVMLLAAVVTVSAAMAEAIGTWRQYLSYSKISKVEPAGGKVYVLADGNLYSYNTMTAEIREYNRASQPALNGSEISNIVWVGATKKLVIIYSDYFIDILSGSDEVSFITGLRDASTYKDKTITNIVVNGKYVLLTTELGILRIDTQKGVIEGKYSSMDDIIDMSAENKTVETSQGTYGTLYYDTANKCWWGADAYGKLTKYIEEDGGFVAASSGVRPDGPETSSCWKLYKHDGKLFVTAGAFAAGMAYDVMMSKGLVQYYDGDKWAVLESPGSMTGTDYGAANCMAFDPKDKSHFYVGARTGLYEYRNYKPVSAYNSENSSLPPLYNKTRTASVITSMAYDDSNNLWAMAGWCDNFINRFDANNQSESFTHSQFSFSDLTTVDIQGTFVSPTNGLMFMVNNYWSKPVLYYYDYKNDRLNGITSFFNDDGTDITPLYLFGLKEDSEGNVWVASSSGPFYWAKDNIRNGYEVFTQHKISRDDGTGLADYLLKNVYVRCMDIDASGRKWFGTDGSGVYLISSDNNSELEHFTTKNSLLPSDVIYDILLDEATGTVWFATSKGLCSYQSDVTETYGNLSDDNVYAYPNPVAPGYTGDITIKGLMDGYQVTITTASGYVVNKGVCSGGSYRWNGCDQNGDRVASGVYMVLVSTNEGEKGCVTKIAMVK
ncbi:MAG: hypothetical protein IJV60_02165 [Prevotella sp.]|nr:hypothetical protein [Prevotella sp.]MBQ8115338.1 hypothetical protein [Prevotella sp.]